MRRHCRPLAWAVLLALLLPRPLAAQGSAAARLRALLQEDWEFRLSDSPESATALGDHRYDDRLADLSAEARARRQAHDRTMLARARAIPARTLAGQDRLSLELFTWEKALEVEGQRDPTWRLALDQMNGPQVFLGQLAAVTRFANATDYAAYLARLRAIPRYLAQVTALLEEGIRTGWTQPATPLRTVPDQLAAYVVTDAAASPLYEPFTRFPAAIPEAERARLRDEGARIILGEVAPAFAQFRSFVVERYLPAGRPADGIGSLPGGDTAYAHLIRRYTTLPLSATELHETGLREVARIRAEMDSVMRATGFTGTFPEFLRFLRTDPRFYHTSAAALVTGYRDIAKRADGALPSLFAELPRLPYGVRPIPDYEAPAQTTGYYLPGAPDGSRPGWFMVNTYKLDARPTYEMEALSLHESVPGHHLQIARAQELRGLPPFRRNAGYTAFVEGWALYAESLGGAMGFYTDPYSRFGQLMYEMWRACRLVIDTGIHAQGWARERAIRYLAENSGKTEQDVAVEVDRYIVWPGQALAYKTGELRIRALRTEAEARLGTRFDLRRFHNVALDDGPLPLAILERNVRAWIAREAAAPR